MSKGASAALTQSIVENAARSRLSIFADILAAVVQAVVDTLNVALPAYGLRIGNAEAQVADAMTGIRATKLLLLHLYTFRST